MDNESERGVKVKREAIAHVIRTTISGPALLGAKYRAAHELDVLTAADAIYRIATNPTTGWRSDMENAPRDADVLTWDGASYTVAHHVYDDRWQSLGTPSFKPTHWQPLPLPPTTPPAGGEHVE